MKVMSLWLAAVLGLPCAAGAESLRCDGGMVAEGDSGVSVIYKCGQPKLIGRYCEPVYYSGTLQVVPEPFAAGVVPCQLVEEWLYERGPGEMIATVYVRSGMVRSIKYGRSPN